MASEVPAFRDPKITERFDTAVLVVARNTRGKPAMYSTAQGDIGVAAYTEGLLAYSVRRLRAKHSLPHRRRTAVLLPSTERQVEDGYTAAFHTALVHENFPYFPAANVIYQQEVIQTKNTKGRVIRTDYGPTFGEAVTQAGLQETPSNELLMQLDPRLFPENNLIETALKRLRQLQMEQIWL